MGIASALRSPPLHYRVIASAFASNLCLKHAHCKGLMASEYAMEDHLCFSSTQRNA
ncbi:hypothetical protein HPP92_028657, partial [Vanilla planifolia]